MASFKSLQDQLGSSQGAEVGALDEFSKSLRSLNLQAKKNVDDWDDLSTAQLGLAKQLKALKDQAAENIKLSKQQMRVGKLSGKENEKILAKQRKALELANKAIEDEAINRKAGVTEIAALTKTVQLANEALDNTRRGLKQEAQSRRQNIKMLAHQAKSWAKHEDRIDEATQGLDKLSSMLGTFAGSGMLASMSNMAAGRKKAVAGIAGAGLIGALLGSMLSVNQKSAEMVQPKFFNYSNQFRNEAGGVDFNTAIQQTTLASADMTRRAALRGLGGEVADDLLTTIGKETGETTKNIVAASDTMFKAIQAGIVPAGEAAGIVSERINSMGISAKQAAREIEDIGLIARRVGSIQMEDMYSSVRNIAQATGSLAASQVDLARSMGVLVKQGDKLGMSYNRRQKAAEGLTSALSANYSQAFSVMNVQNELALAARSSNRTLRGNAKQIQKDLADGRITLVDAARFLKDAGGTTDRGVVASRLARAAREAVSGNSAMVSAQLGSDVTFDQLQILKRVGRTMGSDGNVQAAFAAMGPGGRAAFDGLSKQVGAGLQSKLIMNASLKELGKTFSAAMMPLLNKLPKAIDNLAYSVTGLAKMLGLDANSQRRKVEAQDRGRGVFSLGTKLAVRGFNKGNNEQAVRSLIESKSTRDMFLSKYDRTFMPSERKAIMFAAKTEAEKAIAREVIKTNVSKSASIEIDDSSILPDGTLVETARLMIKNNAAGKTANQQAQQQQARANAEGRRGR